MWALDFQFDHTSGWRVLKYLNMIDEFSRQPLTIEVERSMSGDYIVTILEALINVHEGPGFVRMDNGTEMTSHTLASWCQFSPSNINFKDLRSSWEKAYLECFNGKHPNELLGIELFTTPLETKIKAEDYRQDYNHYPPYSSLGNMAPHEFKQNWHQNNQGLTTVLAH